MTQDRRTRRDALKLFGASAATAAAPQFAFAGSGEAPDPPQRGDYFPLGAVRLGAGPFQDAQRRDADYLLKLEPDRLLANFRMNAGLEPRALVYGGWESVEPWVDIRCHGHTLGHYLGAAACMYESTGDEEFAQRVDYIVTELAECQSKTGGWLAAFPDGVAPLVDSLAGKPFAGVPWYTTHKVLAGLRDAAIHRGSATGLQVLVKFADWIDAQCRPVSDATLQQMLDREHGGMNEVLADLSVLTGNARYRELGLRFSHRALLDPLARKEDRLDGLHANTQIPKVMGFSRLFEVGAPADYDDAARFFWDTVANHRSFASGGHGDGEHFFPKNEFTAHLRSAKTMETCCTHNMLRLTRSLYARDPRVAYMDYFERGLYNGILASQDPDSGMMTYFQSTRPGYVKLFHTPFDSFWCCTGSGMENHARYGEQIYAHEGDALIVNLFIASTLEWRERGLTLAQSTRFPDSDSTRLTFAEVRPGKASTLALRHPAWCPVMTVSVNGRDRKLSRRPGEYFVLSRAFRRGDVVDVKVPMSLRLEPLPNDQNFAALLYGPILLAGIVGPDVDPAAQLIVNERKSGEMLNEKIEIRRWTQPLCDLPGAVRRTDRDSLRFSAQGFAGGDPLTLVPWFRIAHERYNLYWRSEAPGAA